MLSLRVVLSLLVAACVASAADFPDAGQLLIHSDDRLFTGGAVRLQVAIKLLVSVSGMDITIPMSSLLEVAPGERFHNVARMGENDTAIVSDGTKIWTYYPKNNTYSVADSGPGLWWQQISNIVYGRGPREYPVRQRGSQGID